MSKSAQGRQLIKGDTSERVAHQRDNSELSETPRKTNVNEDGDNLLEKIDSLLESVVSSDSSEHPEWFTSVSKSSKGKLKKIQRLSTIRASLGILDDFSGGLVTDSIVSPLRRTIVNLDLQDSNHGVLGVTEEVQGPTTRSRSRRLDSLQVDTVVSPVESSRSPSKRINHEAEDKSESPSKAKRRRKAVYEPKLKDLVCSQREELVGGSIYFKLPGDYANSCAAIEQPSPVSELASISEAKRLSDIQERDEEPELLTSKKSTPPSMTGSASMRTVAPLRESRLKSMTMRSMNLPVPREAKIKTLCVDSRTVSAAAQHSQEDRSTLIAPGTEHEGYRRAETIYKSTAQPTISNNFSVSRTATLGVGQLPTLVANDLDDIKARAPTLFVNSSESQPVNHNGDVKCPRATDEKSAMRGSSNSVKVRDSSATMIGGINAASAPSASLEKGMKAPNPTQRDRGEGACQSSAASVQASSANKVVPEQLNFVNQMPHSREYGQKTQLAHGSIPANLDRETIYSKFQEQNASRTLARDTIISRKGDLDAGRERDAPGLPLAPVGPSQRGASAANETLRKVAAKNAIENASFKGGPGRPHLDTIYMTPITPLRAQTSSSVTPAQRFIKTSPTLVSQPSNTPTSALTASTSSSGSSGSKKVIGNVSGIPTNKRNIQVKTYGQITAVTPFSAAKSQSASQLNSPTQSTANAVQVSVSYSKRSDKGVGKRLTEKTIVVRSPAKSPQVSPGNRPSVFQIFGSSLSSETPLASDADRTTLCVNRASARRSVKVSSAILVGTSTNYLQALSQHYAESSAASSARSTKLISDSCAYCGNNNAKDLAIVSERGNPKIRVCKSHYSCSDCGRFLRSEVRDTKSLVLSLCEQLASVEMILDDGTAQKFLTHYFCLHPSEKHCTRCWKFRVLDRLQCAGCSGALIPRSSQHAENKQIISALGKHYHREHFTCSVCKSKLSSLATGAIFNFYEDKTQVDEGGNGAPVCEKCFDNLYSKSCFRCQKNISELNGDEDFFELEGVNLGIGNTADVRYHSECLKCSTCSKHLADCPLFHIKGVLFCEEHYEEKISRSCDACGEPFEGPRLRLEEFEELPCDNTAAEKKSTTDGDFCNAKSSSSKRRTIASVVADDGVQSKGGVLASRQTLHVHFHCAVCNHCRKTLYHPNAARDRNDPTKSELMNDYRLYNRKVYCKDCFLIYYG